MARKNNVKAYIMLNAVSLGSNHTSASTDVTYLDTAGIYVSWTDTTATGEIIVEARISNPDKPLEVGPWFELDFGEPIALDATGECEIHLNEMPFTDIRIRYEFATGSGTLTARLNAKTVGA